MKKIEVLMSLLCPLLTLAGCITEDDLEYPNQPTNKIEVLSTNSRSEYTSRWQENNFIFPSLLGKEDLNVWTVPTDNRAVAIRTSKYTQRFLGIVVCTTDSEACKRLAPWLDKLTAELPSEWYGMDFLIIFRDVFEDSDTQQLEWVNALNHIEAYSNAVTTCSDNACQRAFFPNTPLSEAGTIYYIDKNNVLRPHEGLTWNTTDDPEMLYSTLRKEVANYLGLEPVLFDAAVGDWENGGTYNN